MLGSRTKQVNAYGRRGSRIVNALDRRDQEPAGSSTPPSDADTPLRRENTTILSPTKRRIALHRHKSSTHSPRRSSLADATAKRSQPKLRSSTRIRQPLTPLRPNGTPSNDPSPPAVKGKLKVPTIKPMHSLKPHSPIIAVDIIVLDEKGSMLTQERRLSHTEIQPNQVYTTAKKSKYVQRKSPRSPPAIVGDDSDLEVASAKPIVKRWNRQSRPIIISSDESEADGKGTEYKKRPVSVMKPHSRSGSSHVNVVIPPIPYQNFKITNRPPSSPSHHVAFSTPALPPDVLPLYLAPPLPITKSRQLTPIRGSSSHSMFRRPPSTPSTPTEGDLSLDLAQLDLSDAIETDSPARPQPGYLIPLLHECAQIVPYEFSAFIETFPFDPVVQSCTQDEDARFRKIGEASYSEVFGIGDVVLKVVPIRFEDEPVQPEAVEIPASSDAKDVLKEIIVTREVGGICDNFVKLLKTYVVKGRYPSLLLDLWDEYYERKGSESIRPDSFELSQVYAIIILPNGGPDLESYAFRNVSKSGWHQACGIFWQVARALEQAERLVNFEHRDLHWGQILVKSVPLRKSKSRCSTRIPMDDTRLGVKVTIIDLGLSRMNTTDVQGSKTYWTPFDDEIFEGEGDYQYDVYRMMRDLIGDAWKSYHPFTNVMWLHYLVTKLLREKRLKLPGGKKQNEGDSRMVSPTGYDEQECYDCLREMERLLGNCIASRQKAHRKTVLPTSGLKSARDVVIYGVRQGWLGQLE